MNIVLFGSRGYLGSSFKELFPDAVCPSADIADFHVVAPLLDEHKPDVVINCAGKTGRPNVDWCEDHKSETVRSNVIGPLVLAEECGKRGIFLVHLGTGCVYTGDESRPFSETDLPNFFGSFYARTKGAIDQLLADFPVLNVRLRMPFDGTSNARNLIIKLRNYERVLDVRNSMTYVPDMLSAVKALIDRRAVGSYNIVNPGVISPYRIMELYKEIVDPSHSFDKLTLGDLPAVARAGRSNCVLSVQKLSNEGIFLQPVEQAVRVALEALKTCM